MRRLGSILLATLAAAAFFLAAGTQPRLLQLRQDYHFSQTSPLENSPPLVAFTTVALGGFRGLLADILWLRATRLQDEGKYFELVQLADWITKLEPRFTAVWAFHAWNMAYNISVLLDAPADRWRWVRHGIELLRDGGLTYSPGDAGLYRELGWLFQHKLGADADQAHLYYKRAWAREMMALFDGPRPDYAALARAAPDRAALLRRPGVAELVGGLKGLGADPYDPGLLDPAGPAEPVRALLARAPGAPELLLFLRAERLRTVYKLQPEAMAKVDAEYGPLDWRLPQAHAIYWAWRGRPYAAGFEQVALDRMIFQSMADAFKVGRLFFNPAEDVFIPSPNFDLLPRVRGVYERALAEHPDQETIRTAHANFLKATISTCYLFNRLREARELFGDLTRRYPGDAEAAGGFEAFLLRSVAGDLNSLTTEEAMALVEGTAAQGFLWRALGDDERAAGFAQLSQLSWQRFMDSRQGAEHRERTGLPPFEDIRRRALDRVRVSVTGEAARARLPAPAATPGP